ncbi:PREDICTED: myosin light chain kinase 2, skeletal/cardiac muscle-like, partial [Buceros rhinoceros silvestris]|uniref:myosin light chain kinase 2, skeletal/cardiac muscle-like n=1 Tax=Buceros rhinoceros silvestris TaxID=175836 RepID=UPI000528AC5F
KAAGEAGGGEVEPAPTAPEPRDGEKAVPAEQAASPARHDGGQAASPQEKVLAAAAAQDGGKDKPGKEKAPAVGEPKGGKAVPAKEKGPAAAGSQDGGKEEPRQERGPAGLAAAPLEGKAPAAAEAEGGKAKPAEETALAAAQARGGEEPVKKVPAPTKAQDGGKKAAKAEKTPADKKPAKEKASATVKAQEGENKVAKVEKAPAAKKAQGGGKEEPAKEKAPAPTKVQAGEKAAATAEKTPAAKKQGEGGEGERTEKKPPAAAKAWEGGKKAAEVEAPLAAAEAGDGGKEPTDAAATAAEAQGEGDKVMKAKEGGEQQQQRGSVPPRPALLQSLSCPATCQREAEPPPSPYLTPDFGKEDPFEILDDVPPPPAPFAHRIVTLHAGSVSSQFNLDSKDILGGGKFGEVHTCTEKQTGLKLAAKVIRKQGAKDKEMVLLEIDVMNQLNHRNLIQLYDAIETPREIILFMEFVEGGELFERIIDDDYHLTEVDCMVFVRQICEGIRFMHHMRVLH